jgi:hypothetical protein
VSAKCKRRKKILNVDFALMIVVTVSLVICDSTANASPLPPPSPSPRTWHPPSLLPALESHARAPLSCLSFMLGLFFVLGLTWFVDRWSVNYFFYNKNLKKLAFFAVWIKSKFRSRDDDDEMRFVTTPLIEPE